MHCDNTHSIKNSEDKSIVIISLYVLSPYSLLLILLNISISFVGTGSDVKEMSLISIYNLRQSITLLFRLSNYVNAEVWITLELKTTRVTMLLTISVIIILME